MHFFTNRTTILLLISVIAYEVLSDEKTRREYDTMGFRDNSHQQYHDGGAHDFNYDRFFQQFDNFRQHRGQQNSHHSNFHFDFGGLFDDDDDFDTFFGDMPHFGHHFAQFDDSMSSSHMKNHMHSVHNSRHMNTGHPGFHGHAEFHQEQTFSQGEKIHNLCVTCCRCNCVIMLLSPMIRLEAASTKLDFPNIVIIF